MRETAIPAIVAGDEVVLDRAAPRGVEARDHEVGVRRAHADEDQQDGCGKGEESLGECSHDTVLMWQDWVHAFRALGLPAPRSPSTGIGVKTQATVFRPD